MELRNEKKCKVKIYSDISLVKSLKNKVGQGYVF